MLTGIQDKISNLLGSRNYDIRVSGNARFIDQKCTPDILSSVAEAILTLLEDTGKKSFTIKEVWESPFAEKIMTELFQKPSVRDSSAAKEYDKVFSQPIALFRNAGIIAASSNDRPVEYHIVESDILTFISLSDRKALDFLVQYLRKVLVDSDLMHFFTDFFAKPNHDKFAQLKSSFADFLIQHTAINGQTECNRIFTKVLNPLAFAAGTYGTSMGRISNAPIAYPELFYNRINFRDLEKPKGISRNEWAKSLENSAGSPEKFQVDKAKRNVKRYESCRNEVNRFSHESADHVHHIFPMCDYPELSDTFENLIVLNPTQHLSYAHPKGNTNAVSNSYQLVCVLAKLNSVLCSTNAQDSFYSLDNFINVINVGLGQDLLKRGMAPELIQQLIAEAYFQKR